MRTYGTVNAAYSPSSWLELSYALGVDYGAEERVELMPPGNYSYNPGYLGKADFVNRAVNHNRHGDSAPATRALVGGRLHYRLRTQLAQEQPLLRSQSQS